MSPLWHTLKHFFSGRYVAFATDIQLRWVKRLSTSRDLEKFSGHSRDPSSSSSHLICAHSLWLADWFQPACFSGVRKCITSIFSVLLAWGWWHYAPPKYLYPSSGLRGVIVQENQNPYFHRLENVKCPTLCNCVSSCHTLCLSVHPPIVLSSIIYQPTYVTIYPSTQYPSTTDLSVLPAYLHISTTYLFCVFICFFPVLNFFVSLLFSAFPNRL